MNEKDVSRFLFRLKFRYVQIPNAWRAKDAKPLEIHIDIAWNAVRIYSDLDPYGADAIIVMTPQIFMETFGCAQSAGEPKMMIVAEATIRAALQAQ